MTNLPIWLLAVLIFCARVCDVTVGTLRTITVVQGLIKLSVLLGFVEILVWITVVSQVVTKVGDAPILAFAYAAGFATGSATGILVERRLALGSVILRVISNKASRDIAQVVNKHGRQVTAFQGDGPRGASTMVWAILARRSVPDVLEEARQLDPEVMYSVEPVREWSLGLAQPLPHATGWRAVFTKK